MLKKQRIICLILLFVVALNIFLLKPIKCYAADGDGMKPVEEDVNSWRPTLSDADEISKRIGIILGVIRIIGILVSVGTLSVIGIKFMLGSVEQKAEYKQTLIPWFIGAVMLFAITTLPSYLYEIVQGLFPPD